jgi:hypothetical protein
MRRATKLESGKQAHRCVESFAHKIDKAIAVGGTHVQKRMPPRELGENRGQMSRPAC